MMFMETSWDVVRGDIETHFYDPNQPRDDSGRWSSGGGGGGRTGGGKPRAGVKRTSTKAERQAARRTKVDELVGKFGEGFRGSAEHMTGWMEEFTPAEAEARRAALAEVTRASYGKSDTYTVNTVEGADGKRVFTPARQAAHEALIADYKQDVGWDNIPQDRKALLSGGLGGAGKGTMLEKMKIKHSEFVTIDPDSLKGYMAEHKLIPDPESIGLRDFDPPVRPMELAGFIHEESSQLSKEIARQAMNEGRNVILDNTMGSDSVFKKVNELKGRGYEVDGVFVDVSIEMSVESALARHMNGTVKGGLGGRFVDPALAAGQEPSDKQYRSANRERFNRIAPELNRSAIIDNQAYAQRPVDIPAAEWESFTAEGQGYVMENMMDRPVPELARVARRM